MGIKVPVHTDFAKAFEAGRQFNRLGELLEMRVRNVGRLKVSSGKLLACDPCSLRYIEDQHAFIKTVPAGDYPVLLAIACPVDQEEGISCAAMVRFTEQPIVKWELALRPGESLSQLKPDSVPFAHSVDGGMSAFVDYAAIKKLPGDVRHDLYVDKLADELEELCAVPYGNTIFGGNDENIVVFKSGFGDGGYSDYWGYTEKGEIAALATDFFILVEEVTQTISVPVAGLKGRSVKHWQLDQAGLKVKVTELNEKTVSIECDGPWSPSVKLSILDDSGNELSELRESSSWADNSSFTYALTSPPTQKCTLSLTFVTGERAL